MVDGPLSCHAGLNFLLPIIALPFLTGEKLRYLFSDKKYLMAALTTST